MIGEGDDCHGIPERVGVLCTGAADPSVKPTNLAHFFLELLNHLNSLRL
jgi:hypothetical protein